MAPTGLAQAAPSQAAPAQITPVGADTIEAEGSELEQVALAKGALGYYWDDASSTYVVVVPAKDESTFTLADASTFATAVRVESRDMTRSTISIIGKDLEGLRPSIVGRGYAYYFDAQSGRVILQSEAPITAFSSVMQRFPGVIEYHSGKFALTNWSNDAEPYDGGAWVNGNQLCTSGFPAKNSAGTRFMITAGHCFTDGNATSMGTAVRLSGQWPTYDLEYIKDRTYSDGIYDSATTDRPVTTASNPSIGQNYCTTGRTTGFVCTWIVRSLNVTICYPSGYPGCAHGLAGFLPPTDQGTQFLLGGDSGGPLWYKHSNGGAGIRGVNSGTFFDIATGRVYSYATEYNFVSSQMGLTAVIGHLP